MRRGWARCVGAVCLVGCASGRPPPARKAHAPATTASARPSISVSPREGDPMWRLARSADPLEQMRLAQAVGAAGLLDGLEDGGVTEETALRALPYADDADIAVLPLAEIAAGSVAERRTHALAAILGISMRPMTLREASNAEELRAAASVLLGLARRKDLPPEDRALVVSALRALADRGVLDPTHIPDDVEPQ